MIEVTIEKLQKDLNDANNNTKGLVAQLEATKQMLNEQLAQVLQCRTNLNIITQVNKDQAIENNTLKSDIENLKKNIIMLAAKIDELTPKQVEGDSNASGPQCEQQG